jgi:protein-tyrosine-phosphatase
MREVSQNQSYSLPAFSRFVLDPDLAKAHLILTMGRESEIFVKKNIEKISGALHQFEQFLPTGSDSHFPDPFLQRNEDYEAHYAKLIQLIEQGCRDLFDSIPFLR